MWTAPPTALVRRRAEGPSQRMAASAVSVAILRDAPLRSAPQDEGRQQTGAIFLCTSYRAASGFSPALVMTSAASGDDRKRSSATAASGCCEFFGSAPTKKVGG